MHCEKSFDGIGDLDGIWQRKVAGFYSATRDRVMPPLHGLLLLRRVQMCMDEADRSTGLKIVDALVRSLKGRLIIRSGASGTRVCVVLPDHSLSRGHRSELDAIAAARVAVDSGQRSHPTNRMGNRFAFATPVDGVQWRQ